MAIFTEQELNEQIAEYKKALKACAANKSYSIAGRSYTRQDIPELITALEWLDNQKSELEGNNFPRVRRAVPRDI